jgi:DNA-binding response OmpR family regulator
VKDTGIGIKEEELEKIFERFYRVNNAEKSLHTGSGIGLTFARRLVELLGGTIHVNSTYGVGSEFIVKLPQLKKLMDNKGTLSEEILMDFGLPTSYTLEETSLDLDIGRDKVFKELLIYLAEDHNDIRNYLANIFSHHFRVKSFKNGKECLESLESELPDLIVSDVMMPEMNGNELCKSIKETDATSHIPVILLTALSSTENRLEGLEVRADEFISKPFHLKFLLLKCYNLLERKEKERENFQKHFMLGHKTKSTNSQHADFIEKLFDIMERNLDNSEFQIDDFSQDFAMNRTQFFKKTKSVTSMTPYELLKNFRLNKAAEMLASNQTTVSEVFFQTGFKSRTHFTKIFKELYGMSPGKFIKQSKNS